MRLGKEQAAGYVADTEAEAPAAEEVKVDQPQRLTPADEPVLPVG